MKLLREIRAEILSTSFRRMKRQNPAFSVRGLAQKMAVSPGFVSRIMNGKSDLPFDRIADFVRHLKIDEISENRLLRTYANAKEQKLAHLVPPSGSGDLMTDFLEISERQFFILSKWFFIAILDLAGCRDFRDNPTWLGKRLGISVREAESALTLLKSHGFLVEFEPGVWKKTSKKMRFPTKESSSLIRDYHALLMKKAFHHLKTKTSSSDFQRRLITGVSCSANPEMLRKATDILNRALYEAATVLSQGECTDVYQIGLQLFPLTESRK